MQRLCLVCLLFLSSCSGSKVQEDENTDVLVDLVESTHIIRTLISRDTFGELLQEHDDEQLSLMLNNYSPAELAFESEVNSSTIPLIVVYYFKDDRQEQVFIELLKGLARTYDDRVKFVIIDADKLFVLAHNAEISTFPTTVLIQDNHIVLAMPGRVTIDVLERTIKCVSC